MVQVQNCSLLADAGTQTRAKWIDGCKEPADVEPPMLLYSEDERLERHILPGMEGWGECSSTIHARDPLSNRVFFAPSPPRPSLPKSISIREFTR